MSKINLAHRLNETVKELSSEKSLQGLFHQYRDGNPMPSGKTLEEIIDLSRSILFPVISEEIHSRPKLSSFISV